MSAKALLTNPALNDTLDLGMKALQCIPAHIGDSYQKALEQTKLFSRCAQHEDWGGWANCIYDGCDCRALVTHAVKVGREVAGQRLAIAQAWRGAARRGWAC